MKIQWRVTPAGAHVARNTETGEDVANVWSNRYTGIIQAFPWGRSITNVGSFEEGKAHCEKMLGAEVVSGSGLSTLLQAQSKLEQALNTDCGKQPSTTPRTLAEVAAIMEAHESQRAGGASGPVGSDYAWLRDLIRAAVKAPLPLAERACATCKNYRLPTDRPPCGDCLRDPVNLKSWVAA